MDLRQWLRTFVALACVLGCGGCVSGAMRSPPLTDEDVKGAAGASDSDDMAALTLRLDDDWFDVVEQDITELEKKTEQFTESASFLYGMLLGNGDDVPAKPADVDLALNKAITAYRELTRYAELLSVHLARYKAQGNLDFEEDSADQFERVMTLIADYRTTGSSTPVRYDAADARSVVALFGAAVDSDSASLSVPKQQRDALELLDWLRAVGQDISFISTAVTHWTALGRTQSPSSHGLSMDVLAH